MSSKGPRATTLRGTRVAAGDAYFYGQGMNVLHPRCTPGLRFNQWMLEKDRASRLSNQVGLRELKRNHGGQVSLFCSHDVGEFERLSGRSAGIPAEKLSAPFRAA